MFAADDFETIRRNMEEIKAEKDLALKGTSAPDADKIEHSGWPMYNSLHAPVADNEYGGL